MSAVWCSHCGHAWYGRPCAIIGCPNVPRVKVEEAPPIAAPQVPAKVTSGSDSPPVPQSGQLESRPTPAGAAPTDQDSLFGAGELQAVEAPEEPVQSIYVHFERAEDLEAFGKLIRFPVSVKTRVLTWPLDELFPERSLSALKAMKPEDDASEAEQ